METLIEKIATETKRLRLASDEWKRLLAAIRRGSASAEVKSLGLACGIQGNALADVVSGIRCARGCKEPASRWPAVEKQWGQLFSTITQIQEKLAGSILSERERALLSVELGELQRQQTVLGNEYYNCQNAARTLAALREEGLAD
jgi:hypothetical protein